MPIDYKKYPPNLKEIRERILKRANNRCEFCGVENYQIGFRKQQGYSHSVIILDESIESGKNSLKKDK